MQTPAAVRFCFLLQATALSQNGKMLRSPLAHAKALQERMCVQCRVHLERPLCLARLSHLPNNPLPCKREVKLTPHGCGSKNRCSKWNTGKWKHGPGPAVCPSCFILSHNIGRMLHCEKSLRSKGLAGIALSLDLRKSVQVCTENANLDSQIFGLQVWDGILDRRPLRPVSIPRSLPSFNHRSFQKPAVFPRVVGGFLERRIPGKNGEATARVFMDCGMPKALRNAKSPWAKARRQGRPRNVGRQVLDFERTRQAVAPGDL